MQENLDAKGKGRDRSSTPARILIRAGWVVDGTGGPVLSDAVITTENGVIQSVGKGGAEGPPDCDTVDLQGLTLLPPLVDAHVHLAFSGSMNPEVRKWHAAAPYQQLLPLMERRILNHLACGVAAVRDAGDKSGHTLAYRRDGLRESGIRSIIKAGGPGWHAPGRYGAAIGRTPAAGSSLALSIARSGEGADHVKLIQSGLNSLKFFGRETRPQFSARDLRDAVAAAEGLGLSAMVHANGAVPASMALEAGCASIEHGFFMGRAALEKAASSGAFWVPTACTMQALAETLPAGSHEAGVAARNLEHQLEQIRAAVESGVLIALGTDSGTAGVDHGPSAAAELALFAKAGMSTAQAVKCATLNGARLLGLEDRMGALIPGMPATFIAVSGPPSGLFSGKIRPSALYIQGRALEKAAFSPRPDPPRMRSASP